MDMQRDECAPRYHRGEHMGWRQEIRDRIAELEQRRLLLEDERLRARMLGSPEGERLEEARAKLQEISHQINDLRASLE
jgi:coenzyme F420-reducing hydrogenase delta subunit